MKYRSTFEGSVALALGNKWKYEAEQMNYHVPRKYNPDFVYTSEDGRKVYMECKGFFREGDTQKYRAIKAECDVLDIMFIFVLMNPDKKVRKGATLSMSGWCEKNGIPWFTLETLQNLKELEDVY